MTAQDSWNCDLDAATARRLQRLSTRPVDTQRLEQRLRAAMGDAAAPIPPSRRLVFPTAWVRTWATTAAAAIVLLVSITAMLLIEPHAVASPAAMVQLHRNMVAGQVEPVQTETQEALYAMIASGWDGENELPALPDHVLESCCLQSVDGRPVLGMLVLHEGVPVSVLMADSRGAHMFDGKVIELDGRSYTTRMQDDTAMVMTEWNGRMLCFMGDIDQKQLASMASGVMVGLSTE